MRDREKLTELLKGTDVVVLLAAEHRDDVTPLSLYYDVNVGGCRIRVAMEPTGETDRVHVVGGGVRVE